MEHINKTVKTKISTSDISEQVTAWWNAFSVVYAESNPAFVEFHRRIIEIALNILVAHHLPISNSAIIELLSNDSELLKLSASLDPKPSVVSNYLNYNKDYRDKLIAAITPALQHEMAPKVSLWIT